MLNLEAHCRVPMASLVNGVFVVMLLPLILLQLQGHTAPVDAAAVAKGVAAPRVRRTLVTQEPQLTAGGELKVRVHSPTPGPSPTSCSRTSEKDGQMSPAPTLDPGVSRAGGELKVRVHCPTPGPSPTSCFRTSEKDGQMSPAPPLDPGICTYKIRTQTGDQWTAGTDATISIRLENSEQDNIYMVLTAGSIDTGDQDTFSIQGRCVPQICKLILYTDATGWLPCWYAVFVDVSVTPLTAGTPENEASDYQKWPVEQWLPAHEWSSASSLVRDHCPKSNTT